MKKLLMILSLLLLVGGTTEVHGQWLKDLGKKAVKRAEKRAKDKVEDKVNKTVDKTVDGAFEGAEDVVKGEGKKGGEDADAGDNADEQMTDEGGKQQKGQSLEMTYAKSDFVAGDEIIFEDNMQGEQTGEFPSQWDLERGNAEIAKLNGETVIAMLGSDSWIKPLMTSKDYFGEVFTVEFDMMCPGEKTGGSFELDFMKPTSSRDNEVFTITWSWYNSEKTRIHADWRNLSDERKSASYEVPCISDGQWHHFALSFNKRALKFYVDGSRVISAPNVQSGAGWITWWISGEGDKYLRNVRIAKGAVPLYDRMMTDGKFITYGITFDVGKSTIKPESMGEINRIVKLMTDNPDLKFSVEGHTDSTGNAASNQTLSEARSKAIVDKLVELGISADRLASAGKGQNSPIADNNTDEGRAKNRRVEFVKL